MKNSKITIVKDLITMSICWCLFLYDIGIIYAQVVAPSGYAEGHTRASSNDGRIDRLEQDLNFCHLPGGSRTCDDIKKELQAAKGQSGGGSNVVAPIGYAEGHLTQEEQARRNQAAHKASDSLGKLSKCGTGNTASEDNRIAQRQYQNSLMMQGFDDISQAFTEIEGAKAGLDQQSANLNNATSAIGLQGGGQSVNIEKQKKLESERKALNKAINTHASKVEEIKKEMAAIRASSSNGLFGLSRKQKAKLSELNALRFKERALYLQAHARRNRVKAEMQKNSLVNGAGAVSKADVAVGVARHEAGIQEQKYNELLEKIKAHEDKADENLRIAEQRIIEVQNESKHNADFAIFEQAKAAPDESTEAGRNTISNLEILSMASAAMTSLKCVDISRVKSRAYPLFKAAAATYIANHLNTTSEYTKVAKECILKCVSLDAIQADQMKSGGERQYPQFENLKMENATANCKTDDGKDGLFENDNVAADDEDEQFAAIERMAALYKKLEEFTDTKVASQEEALKLFQAAHAAALMEVTAKATVVAAAQAQLDKAYAEEKKAKKSIKIYLAIIAMLVAINSTCPGCCGCRIGAIAAAAALLAMYKKDLAQAKKDIAKWKKELQEARIHTHMMCNYPGQDAELDSMIEPSTVPLIYPKSTIMQQVTAQVKHPELNSKSKIATTIEWIRNLQGANQSLAYDERIPTKVEMLGILQKVGLYLKDKTDNIGDRLADVMFPIAHAVDLESGIGLHNQAGSFSEYLNMKLGAWKLQTHNASLKVNLRESPVTIEHLFPHQPMMQGFNKYMNKNSPTVFGDLIEQTGFPLPETRAGFLQTIVDKLINNIEMNSSGLAKVQSINNQYAELLEKARVAMDVSAGITDAAMEIKRSPNVCISGDAGGSMSIDEKCACKSANTCTNFKMPSFGTFSAGDMSTNSQFLTDGANAFAKGDSKAGKLSFGKMSDSSNALKSTRDKLSSYNVNMSKSSKYGSSNKSGLKSGTGAKTASMKGSKGKYGPGGSSGNISNSKYINSKNNKNAQNGDSSIGSGADDKGLAGKSGLTTSSGLGILSSSGNGASGAASSGGSNSGTGSNGAFGVDDLSLDGLDNDNISQADVDFAALKALRERDAYLNGRNGTSGSDSSNETHQGSTSAQRGSKNGTYIGVDGQVYKSTDGITLNPKESLFDIVSKRYKISAMPVLLQKKSKDKEGI